MIPRCEQILDEAAKDPTVIFLDALRNELKNFIVDKLVLAWNKYDIGYD